MRHDGTFTVTRLAALGVSLTLVASLLLAACGSSSTGTTAGSQPTTVQKSGPASQVPAAKTSAPASQSASVACPFLTKQEVETAIGKPVLNPDVLDGGETYRSCSFRDTKSVSVMLVAVGIKSGSQAKLAFQTRKSNATDPKPIAGIGDDAFWEESANNLEILKGNNAVTLTIDKAATSDRPKVAQDLAKKVLDRLP